MAQAADAKQRRATGRWRRPEAVHWAAAAARQSVWRPWTAIRRVARPYPRGALDLVFPAACVSCEQDLAEADEETLEAPICRSCLGELALLTGPACRKCGAPMPNPIGRCNHCHGRRNAFHAAIAAGSYKGRFRELLLRMKHAEGDRVSLAMGKLVWSRCREPLLALDADLVAPVPLHWRRRLARGTNSAAVLAEVLARRLDRPLRTRLLWRRRNTPPQSSVSPAQRRANVRGAFSVRRSYPIEKAHVLLVDDIMTSGATCHEVSRVLRRAGARRVTVLVAARAV